MGIWERLPALAGVELTLPLAFCGDHLERTHFVQNPVESYGMGGETLAVEEGPVPTPPAPGGGRGSESPGACLSLCVSSRFCSVSLSLLFTA